MIQMIKKYLLLLLRNPMELLLLFGLPIILITILGTALSSFMTAEEIEIDLDVAMVTNGAESSQINRFLEDLAESELPPKAIEQISVSIEEITPQQTLVDVFKSEDLQDMVTLDEINQDEKQHIIDEGVHQAVIEFEEDFTYDFLHFIFLDGNKTPGITILHNEEEKIGASIVDQIVTSFQEQYTLSVFMSEKGINPSEISFAEGQFEKEIDHINQLEPITSKAYYAIGMVVMNVLFMATAISTISFEEKRSLVFNRLVLANISRWSYFLAVLLAGTILAFIQTVFVFAFSYIVFDVTWPDLFAFLLTTVTFSLAVGGLGVLLTAISFRVNSEQVINIFSSVIVIFFAFLGGSFFPIGDYSAFIQMLGEFTPNGAAMSAYMSIIRGEDLVAITNHLIYILSFTILSIIVAIWSFPKRGAI